MQELVECVPNFSNGRDPDVYLTIADAIRSVHSINLLDVSADADHNRTVITFVGRPKDVVEAAFRGIAKAAQLINMDEQTGEHPRLGATDVCPLIPIRGVTMADCVAFAQQLGRRVGDELDIPVYLYGRAASRPSRVKLSDIRKGEYERWKTEIGMLPDRQPDYGPAEARTTGATVIGVRPFLIAYNLFLNSSDVAVADTIAKRVRESNGGLRNVQAKGFLVDGQAQVSMNLIDFYNTPIHLVQELVRREANNHGLTVSRAELVGLIPQQALVDSAKYYLQLHDMYDDQVLENRIQQKNTDTTPYDFVDATAEALPTPAGGSVSALTAALAAALTQMVAGLTTGRKRYASVEADARVVLDDARSLREELTATVMEDAAAYTNLMAARRNRELEEPARNAAIQKALFQAIEVPLKVVRLGRDVAELAHLMAKIGNRNAVGDAAAAAMLARAAVQASTINVKINTSDLDDDALIASYRETVTTLEAETIKLAEQTAELAAERGGF